ncbi:acyl-CoA dehydrogenase family protein [Microcoleus anatoxicus]|uniref:Acyl-CoA dehydrogenase family protein n=1 Tax=Microcoleus anatoxicus PTRS2 TaxID=2705321 RepID=A0ABU8YGZ3_9CYAN|nr:MAG: acyl-CoA dehydrogenase [Oscillatoriales cyanobacterium]
MDFTDILNTTETYLKNCVAADAETIDSDSEALKTALVGLEDRSLLALRVPQKWGGADIDAQTFYEYQELTARYSGALGFLQTQHHSATAMLANSDNELLKSRCLPAIALGELRLGVGFSHLRRSGNPAVTATPAQNGYLLSGKVPWVTGFGLFQNFIVAALLPDDRAVFGLLPFENIASASGKISCSEVMPLIAMSSTNTVTVTMSNWLLDESKIISFQPKDWILKNDTKNILNFVPATFGCIRAGLDIIQAAGETKKASFIVSAYEKLAHKLDRLKQNFPESQHSSKAEQLAVRAQAIDLAVRCGHAAVAVSSGAANSQKHSAGRVYREALVYTVSGQTQDVMAATLDELIKF